MGWFRLQTSGQPNLQIKNKKKLEKVGKSLADVGNYLTIFYTEIVSRMQWPKFKFIINDEVHQKSTFRARIFRCIKIFSTCQLFELQSS